MYNAADYELACYHGMASSMDSRVASIRDMNNSYHIPGVIVLDGFLHSFAQGIILTQAFKYWDDFTDDSRRKRLFVLTVVSLVMSVPQKLPCNIFSLFFFW